MNQIISELSGLPAVLASLTALVAAITALVNSIKNKNATEARLAKLEKP